MSRISQSTAHRTLVLVGVLLVGGLIVPASGHAQTPSSERTLLNHVVIPSFALGTPQAGAPTSTAARPAALGRLDGTRALLGQAPAHEEPDAEPIAITPAGPPIDGARALLGRRPPAESRRGGAQ